MMNADLEETVIIQSESINIPAAENPLDNAKLEDPNQVFSLAMTAGEILLGSGAEIFRVEDTMLRIAASFGLETLDVFIIANGIFATADSNGSKLHAKVKHIPTGSVHLGKVEAVNDLSRRLEKHEYSVEEAKRQLIQIQNYSDFPIWMSVLASGVGSMSFCFILGGSLKDSSVSMLIGCILGIYIVYTRRYHFIKSISNIIGSCILTALAIAAGAVLTSINVDKIIIGSIIPLVPGVSFTNAIRDLTDNHYISGIVRMLDAIIIAASISVGVGITLHFFGM